MLVLLVLWLLLWPPGLWLAAALGAGASAHASAAGHDQCRVAGGVGRAGAGCQPGAGLWVEARPDMPPAARWRDGAEGGCALARLGTGGGRSHYTANARLEAALVRLVAGGAAGLRCVAGPAPCTPGWAGVAALALALALDQWSGRLWAMGRRLLGCPLAFATGLRRELRRLEMLPRR